MRKAVSVVFTHREKIFAIKRQNYLSVFPGYLAFPGGKVDSVDATEKYDEPFLREYDGSLMHALVREVQEELGVSLTELPILRMEKLAVAITPEFNPYRFETIFFWIELKEEFGFICDEGEVEKSFWINGGELLKQYREGQHLAVPPTVKIIERFSNDNFSKELEQLRLPYDPAKQVPWIESISGVLQFLPLSHTFPPANRTNCFLIGDVLIDPSPKDEAEYKKLVNSIVPFGFSKIFLTHHHPDHHEYAPQLARELDIPIYLSKDSLERIEKRWGKEYFEGIKIVNVTDGDVLTTWKDEKVFLMSVPGHDEGQMAPYVKSGKWVIASDLFQSVGTVVVGGEEGNMAKYFSSLEKVIALGPLAIFPSHGIALGGTHKLEMTLKHRRHREAQILELVKKGKTASDIYDTIYRDLDERLRMYAEATIEKHLDKLKQEAKI